MDNIENIKSVAEIVCRSNGNSAFMWRRASDMLHGIAVLYSGVDSEAEEYATFISDFCLIRGQLCNDRSADKSIGEMDALDEYNQAKGRG